MARIAGVPVVSGISRISLRTTSTKGWSSRARVTDAAKSSRSTARARPAGTAVASAVFMISESSRRISSFRSPTAEPMPLARRELLQTSSARCAELCAGLNLAGFISYNRTGHSRFAACHAASQPARPPPIITICLRFFMVVR